MTSFVEYTENLLKIIYTRKVGKTENPDATIVEDQDMGNKQSKISPPGSPKTDLTKVQNGRIKKPLVHPGKLVGRKPVKEKRVHGSNSESSEDEDEPMTDNSVSEDEPDIDKEGVSDDDFGSHHSNIPETPPESEDPDSDAESHPSGIGSDRSVHTTPEEEEEMYDYPPDGDDEVPGDEKVDFFLDVQHKVRMRAQDRSDWHEGEIKLWDELDLRGTQPLLPLEWAGDFPTCPPILFSDDYEQTFLNSTSGDEFAGRRFKS